MDKELYGLAERLGQKLKANGQKIAVAESCTGGWLAQSITDIPGSSAWFDRGFVTYSNQAKTDMLGVNPLTLETYGAVSAETAREMVAGALAHSGADWAVAITGIAGPDGGSPEKPVGTVYIAWKNKAGILIVLRNQFSGERRSIRKQAVFMALRNSQELFDADDLH